MRLVRRTVAPVEPVAPARVLLRSELVRQLAAAASESPDDETGGPLFGTVERSWEGGPDPTLIASVLGTVPPGGGVRGGPSSVALGAACDGERAASALRWLRSVTGLDLQHLGDWHTHPGGDLLPSGGDVITARAMRARSGSPLWLVAIAAGRRSDRDELSAVGAGVRHERKALHSLDVRFYCEAGGSKLVPVPTRVEAGAIPRLPPLPWHVADSQRFAAECRLLAAEGFRIGIEDGPGHRPELALLVRRDGEATLRLVTGPGYPSAEPVLLDDRERRVVIRGWSPERFLVDLVREARP